MNAGCDNKRIVVAVASGKGGTGKTTVAVSMALSAPGLVRLIDCDVEEPHCHLFLKPTITGTLPVSVPVPVVDEDRCTACGRCAEICQYNAIASLKTKALVFPELCHGCGGCVKVCPVSAIAEGRRDVGHLSIGRSRDVEFVEGRLRVGEAQSPPLIRAIKRYVSDEGLTLIDAPPGTSCPVIASVRGADYVILVTEPTSFGLHDLKLAVETVRKLELPFGVVINRADAGDGRTHAYCAEEGIRILMEIPDDRRIAEAYSRGKAAVEALPELRTAFRRLGQSVQEELDAARSARLGC